VHANSEFVLKTLLKHAAIRNAEVCSERLNVQANLTAAGHTEVAKQPKTEERRAQTESKSEDRMLSSILFRPRITDVVSRLI
jgi:hypothetical protein